MRPYRNLKMASVIQETLNEMFLRDFDFEGALVTIADVTIDEKLETARVKLTILPFEKGPETYKIIEARRRELQYKLIRKMNVRLVPRLKFEIVQ
jgi:ribosome-binding factor A